MNDTFAHCLEDEWDDIFEKLREKGLQNFVLPELIKRDGNLATIDDAFNCVMKQGNEGFHRFVRLLAQQVCLFCF